MEEQDELDQLGEQLAEAIDSEQLRIVADLTSATDSQADIQHNLLAAAVAVHNADVLLFTAGAGLGVDSGLPDFRGPEGFWRAYPPMKKLGLKLENMSNPKWFLEDPHFAWGFFGHRYHLYKDAVPHHGYEIMKKWGEEKARSSTQGGYFVFTSNVDGMFFHAGFDPERIVECHGTIHFLQCVKSSSCVREGDIWPVPPEFRIEYDTETFRAKDPLPKCRHCGGLARPNILMFYDGGFEPSRTDQQHERLSAWADSLNCKTTRVCVVEVGAGLAVPTVRHTSENFARMFRNATLVRINPREPEGPPETTVPIPMGGAAALQAIDALVQAMGSKGT